MITTVFIGEHKYRIAATLGALMIYKQQFNEEYLDKFTELELTEDISELAEGMTITGFRLLWAMCRAAGEDVPPPDEWVAGLGEVKNLLSALIKAQALFTASTGPKDKKKTAPTENKGKIKTEEFLALAIKAGIGYEAAMQMTIGGLNGVVGSMISNDKKEAVRIATQADFDRF